MTDSFVIMDRHMHDERTPRRRGRVVLSQLGRGGSLIGAKVSSLKLVLEGEETYRIDGRLIRLQPGQFGYFEAGANFEEFNRSEAVGLCLLFPHEELNVTDQYGDLLLGRSVVLPTMTNKLGVFLNRYAQQLARESENRNQIADELLANLRSIVFSAFSDCRRSAAQLPSVKASTRAELLQRLERARGHLHENANRSVSLLELARFAGLSQFHLARYFKMAFGRSVISYHRIQRLMKAADLIRDGRTVAVAAEFVGYSDAPSFTHAFTREFGLSPKEYVCNECRRAA